MAIFLVQKERDLLNFRFYFLDRLCSLRARRLGPALSANTAQVALAVALAAQVAVAVALAALLPKIQL